MSDPAPEPVLHLDRVGLVRDGRAIVDDVTWRVDAGQRWVVLGRNGSGKTSLLRIASLLVHPTRGQVHVLGQTLGRTDVRRLRARLGLVSAALADQLRPGLTAHDVVRTGRFAVSWAGSSMSHSTFTSRSRSSTLLTTVRQSRAWTVRPRPRVMKPTIWSPGRGLQHFAKRTSRSSTPRIRTPCSVFGRVPADAFGRSTVSSVAPGAILLSSWCTEALP